MKTRVLENQSIYKENFTTIQIEMFIFILKASLNTPIIKRNERCFIYFLYFFLSLKIRFLGWEMFLKIAVVNAQLPNKSHNNINVS